jgi:hypothetical protein
MDKSKEKSNYFSLKLPEYHKAKVELWRYLNPNNMDALLACFEIDDWDEFLKSLNQNEAKSMREINGQKASEGKDQQYNIFSRLIATQLNLDLKNHKHIILIDKYYYLIKFGLANSFNKVQINALISIIKRTHELAIETSFGNLDETFDFFKNLLIAYCVHEPPHSLSVFTPKQIEIVIEYFVNSYFKSFKFYKYVFAPAIYLDIDFDYTNMPKNVHASQVLVSHSEPHLNSEGFNERNDTSLKELDETNEESLPTGENEELKEFVKSFLMQKLDKMKTEIISDITTGKQSPVKSPKNKRTPEAKSPVKKK